MPGPSWELCRPATRVADVFDVSEVANIQDPVVSPTAGDGVSVHAADFNDQDDQYYVFQAPLGFESIDRVILYVYGKATVSGSYRIDAFAEWAGHTAPPVHVEFGVADSAYAWKSCTDDGAFDPANFATDFQLHLKTYALGAGESFDVDAAYAVVYGIRAGAAGSAGIGGAGNTVGSPYPQII